MTDKIRIQKTPQGTVDVMIGQIVIKTCGGHKAEQAAQDFANQIRQELQTPEVDARSFSSGITKVPEVQSGPTTASSNITLDSGRDTDRDAGEENIGQQARGWLRGRVRDSED